MSTEKARDELAQTLKRSEAAQTTFEHKLAFHLQTAGDLLRAGYRKPAILGYVIVGRDGQMLGAQYPTKDAAQAMADEWTKDCDEAGVDWDYRVAEIVEPTA